MIRGVRALMAITSATMFGACSAVLGLRDIDEASPSALAPGTDADATDSSTDEESDSPRDAVATGFCAAYPSVIACEDFESGSFSSTWTVDKTLDAFALVHPRTGAVDGGANRLEGYFGFNPIPNVGVAALTVPLPNGRRAIRFQVNAPLNGWPASGVGLAAMVDAVDHGIRVVAEQNDAGTFEFVLRNTDGTLVVSMGYIVAGSWTCLEVDLDNDGTVHAGQNGSLATGSVSATLATTPLIAQIGMLWSSYANPGSKYVSFDDVVVATGAVGCPPP